MANKEDTKIHHHIPNHAKFIIGGLSGMGATMFVQPLDLIKNRMQLSGEGGAARDYTNSVHALKSIVKKEGFRGLYSGLSANLFRQSTYTTARMGIYQVTLEHYQRTGHTGFLAQVSAGLLAGFIGAIIATPSDVALVRMTANGKLPPSERRNYKNIFDALRRIAVEEGRTGIFAGLEPTVLRAMVANVSQLVSYSQAKHFLIGNGYMEDNAKCHFTSSLFSGLVYAFVSCPLDVAKTRMSATTMIQPLDVLKNRMQLSGEGGTKRDHSNTFQAFRNIVAKEGAKGLYQGISANILRQATYTTTRLGMYQNGVEILSRAGYDGFSAQVSAGLAAGMVAAVIGAPPDVALVRMMSDGRLLVADRRNYKHVGNAIYRMAKEEGVLVLWRGVRPAMLRAMVGSVSQLVTYSQAKHYLIKRGLMRDGPWCHFASSLLSGLVYTAVSNPIDMAKTRIQTMKTINGKPRYTGLVDVWVKTVQKEGVRGLWKGFLPYYMRMGPHTTLLLVFTEQFTYLYSVYFLHNTTSQGF